MTLRQLAVRLKHMPAKAKSLRIAVIERNREMWSGVPYGSRSTIGALAFQKLQEFLQEPERTYYINWLSANAASWLDTLKQYGGLGAEKWISDNHSLMQEEKWGEIYLPRFLFGQYVSSDAARAIDELARTGIAAVTLIHGEVTAVARTQGGLYTIAVEQSDGARTPVYAQKVVLAIGSPPQKAIGANTVVSQLGHTHIEDLYLPSEDINIQKIQQTLSSLPDKNTANILIVGSNASALELLYLINYRPEIRSRAKSFVVLSRSGLLPYTITEETPEFKLSALNALFECDRFSAVDLMRAIRVDIRQAEGLRLNIADLRDPVGSTVSQLTALMHISEQKKFVCEHGVHYSRLMRRAGRQTRFAADELASEDMLTTVRGDFRRLEPSPLGNGLVYAVYASQESLVETTYPVPFSITINCGGFEELDASSSRLINSLMENEICKANSTKRGFLVSGKLEASENFYVIGPLVGGNFNETVRLWHVESAARINGLAELLAKSLTDSLFPPDDVRRSSPLAPAYNTGLPLGF